MSCSTPLVDAFNRRISYLRLSVTDRCDLRCTYCMPEAMQFLPKKDVLSLEELHKLSLAFIERGISKIRLTGGEPLVRRDVVELITALGRKLGDGLEELTLTTNGTRLGDFARDLAALGVKRVNVSLDSLDPETFRRLTRGGDLNKVLAGLAAARDAGLAVKVNAVALAQDNRAELPALLQWAHGEGYDLTLIETMPMGEVEADRTDQFVSLADVVQDLAAVWTLTPIDHRTGGPARYLKVEETGRRLGLITPLSHNFCEACNRVRLTCTGTLHTCLGQDDATDLRAILRAHPEDDAPLYEAIREAVALKPKGHDFHIGGAPAVARHMSTTGG
jgi:GTP 3',8-cyclase